MAANYLQRLQAESQKLLQQLSTTQKIVLGGLGIATVIAIVAISIWAQQPQWSNLYTGLNEKDAGAIVDHLRESKMRYELQDTPNGTLIRVPQNEVHELRLDMASRGLPKEGGVVGFELFDKDTMGMTNNLFDLNHQRAMEGELARTMMQMEGVERARVHLALPKKQLFTELEEESTAAVTLKLRPNVTLTPEQVKGLGKLVAGGVPGLAEKNITITDTQGHLLLDPEQANASSAQQDVKLNAQQLDYQRTIEKQIRQDVERMLTRVVGREHVNVQVKADIDFDKEESLIKDFKSNNNQTREDVKALRSTKETRENSRGRSNLPPAGVPGVNSNIPSYQEVPAEANNAYVKEDIVRNYEVPETQTKRVKATGNIRRLTLSVAINTASPALDAPPEGLESDDPKLQNLRDLAIAAAGVDLRRGDTVAVRTLLFDDSEQKAANTAMDNAAQMEFWRSLATTGLLALAVITLLILLYLAFGRRNRKVEFEEDLPPGPMALNEPPEMAELTEAAAKRALALNSLTQMAKDDPAHMARLLRAWMADHG